MQFCASFDSLTQSVKGKFHGLETAILSSRVLFIFLSFSLPFPFNKTTLEQKFGVFLLFSQADVEGPDRS